MRMQTPATANGKKALHQPGGRPFARPRPPVHNTQPLSVLSVTRKKVDTQLFPPLADSRIKGIKRLRRIFHTEQMASIFVRRSLMEYLARKRTLPAMKPSLIFNLRMWRISYRRAVFQDSKTGTKLSHQMTETKVKDTGPAIRTFIVSLLAYILIPRIITYPSESTNSRAFMMLNPSFC